jgi:hypothetical protein
LSRIFYSFSEYLLTKGVDCFHDNIKLVTTTHIVFLCVLPSQVPAIADEVKAEIPQTLFLYSFASSITARKLRQLFGTTNIIHPDYTWDLNSNNDDWDFSINVNTALENISIVSTTCPLRKQKCKIFNFLRFLFCFFCILSFMQFIYKFFGMDFVCHHNIRLGNLK